MQALARIVAVLASAAAVTSPGVLVVTTSMLEQAVREVLPADAAVEVVRLAPPGACPGHFDLSPRALPALRRASAFIRHGFQSGLDPRLTALGLGDLRVVPVEAEGSLLVPSAYLRVVDDAAAVVAAMLPGRFEQVAAARSAAAVRLERLEQEVRAASRDWRGRPVIAGPQQAALCRWLGLEVVGVLDRPEELTPRDLARLVALEPQVVVGNLQSDGEAARALAARLGVPVAVLSNFPGAEGYGTSYDELVRANLQRLAAAWMVQ